jgi:hypothetical protein
MFKTLQNQCIALHVCEILCIFWSSDFNFYIKEQKRLVKTEYLAKRNKYADTGVIFRECNMKTQALSTGCMRTS